MKFKTDQLKKVLLKNYLYTLTVYFTLHKNKY